MTWSNLVENAIKHGLAPKSERGLLSVRVRLEGTEVLISVAGTGTGIPFKAASWIARERVWVSQM
jgi:LytS/YehU family sensor histidine kinase